MSRSLPAPDVPEEYSDDNDIPFGPDGNGLINNCVEKVIGRADPFDGLRCVRKTIIREPPLDRNATRRRLLKETTALHNARHKHVVQLFHAYFDKRYNGLGFCIVMDRADTNLTSYLDPGLSKANLPRRCWFGCLLLAVQHIHGLGIRHRDIKPSNILVKNNQVLLADFGISQMGLGNTIPTTALGRSSQRARDYCAPEVERGSTRGRSADMFALGAVFLEMCVVHSEPDHYRALKDLLWTKEPKGYANNVERVHEWVDAYGSRLGRGSWQAKIVEACKMMLQSDRNRRPIASALNLGDPLLSCTCANTVPATKESALLEACKGGSTVTVTRLLSDNVSPCLMGAIHLAAERGFEEIVRLLLDKGAGVDSRNQVEQTPLHCASRSGCESVVKLLLSRSASVNVLDEDEQTPLHGAAAHGYESIVRMLLRAGANTHAKNAKFKQPYTLAKGRGHAQVLQILDDWIKSGDKVLHAVTTAEN